MKVLLHYEDNDNTELHKSLKITLPKSWKTGPTSQLLNQFVESYNSNETLGSANPLTADGLHLAIRVPASDASDKSELKALASDAVVVDCISDRADVYIQHGAARTLGDIEEEESQRKAKEKETFKNSVQCTRFGCKNRFPKGGPYPKCHYHKSPPVFHETAKFWSCCPNKKAYDWEDFQGIPGCQTADACTEIKENEGKLFLGGTDLREQAGEVQKLKSIDDFNKAQAAGGAEAAPVLDRLRNVLGELGIERELFEQVIEGMRKEIVSKQEGLSDAEILELVKADMGSRIKTNFKSIAAEQLRIK